MKLRYISKDPQDAVDMDYHCPECGHEYEMYIQPHVLPHCSMVRPGSECPKCLTIDWEE